MRRMNRKQERYTATHAMTVRKLTQKITDPWTRVWQETNLRAAAYARKHNGRSMNNIMWLDLWERVRDELMPTMAWATERQRGYATALAMA